MKKFVISVDSCVDRLKGYLHQHDITCIVLKRCTDGVETAELFENFAQIDDFYDQLKNGALPTTSQLNPSEVFDYFCDISKNCDCEVIHISLSSGLSNTFSNCQLAAKQVKDTFGKTVHVFDSLSASFGIAMQLDFLIELRDSGADAQTALKKLTQFRDNQQVWVSMGDLFHLKRGGRISGFKAAIGTVLNVRPILVINKFGKLSIEKSIKGTKKSLQYIAEKVNELKNPQNTQNFGQQKIYIAHGCSHKEFEALKGILSHKFPHHKIEEGAIGSIIGTHLGVGSVAIIFQGAPRLDI